MRITLNEGEYLLYVCTVAVVCIGIPLTEYLLGCGREVSRETGPIRPPSSKYQAFNGRLDPD